MATPSVPIDGYCVFELLYGTAVVAGTLVLLLRSRIRSASTTRADVPELGRPDMPATSGVHPVHFDFYQDLYNVERERSDRIMEAFALPVGVQGALAGGLAYLWLNPLSRRFGFVLLILASVFWFAAMFVLGSSYMPRLRHLLPEPVRILSFELEAMAHFEREGSGRGREYVEKELSAQFAEATEKNFRENHLRLAGIKQAVILIGASVLAASGIILMVAYQLVQKGA